MRGITKPSTAQCNLDIYTLFLLSEPKYGGCSRLAEILGDVSHDSINRFLLRERYEPKDLFSIMRENYQPGRGDIKCRRYSHRKDLQRP